MYATRATFTVTLTVWDSLNQNDTDTLTITVVNRPPIANGGTDQNVLKKVLVALDARLSSDPDLDTLSFAWSQVSGPAITLTAANTATPTFTPPVRGVYTFRVNVTDGNGGFSLDTVSVNATNRAPTANAGPDQAGFLKGVVISLDGTGSGDPDLDTLSFAWTQIGGPAVTLANPTAATTTFTTTVAGLRTFHLAVDDLDGGTATDDVAVDVRNMAPVADLTADLLSALIGQAITFDGSASTDPDGTIASWTLAFGDGNSATGSGTPTTLPHAYAAPGTYVPTINVTDDEGASDIATLIVTITVDLPPVAAAGPDQAGTLATIFSFDGSASTDDHGIVAWLWDFGDGGTANTPVTAHTFGSRATFTVTLTVRDAVNQVDTDTLAVVVANRPPIPNAGTDQTVLKNTFVTLDASLSSDPDLDTLSFEWSQVSGSAVTLTAASTATPTFTPPTSSVYAFEVSVTDGNGGSATDTVDVEATNRPPVANAGDDQQDVGVDTPVTLNGTLSADPDGDPLAYAWTRTSGPASVTLTDANTARPTFTPTIAGTYVFSLTVSDGTNTSVPDTVTIVVVAPIAPRSPDVMLPFIVGLLALFVILFLVAFAARRRRKPEEELEGGEGNEDEEEGVDASPGDEESGPSEEEDEFEL